VLEPSAFRLKTHLHNAGSIKGHKITLKEFLMTMRFYELLTHAQQEASPKSESLTLDQLRALTWQTIIVSREAKREGIKISDSEVQIEIKHLFSVHGEFDLSLYEEWVRKNFRSQPRDFEETVRKHLTVQKMREKIISRVPDAERDNRWLEWLRNTIGNAQLKDYTAKDYSTTE